MCGSEPSHGFVSVYYKTIPRRGKSVGKCEVSKLFINNT